MATSSWAVEKVEFYQANAKDYIKLLNKNKDRGSSAIGKTLGLTQDEEFKLLRKIKDFNGVTHYRYQQSYKGIPVWGMNTNVGISPANDVVRLHGTMVLDIPGDVAGIPSSLDPLSALIFISMRKKRPISVTWFPFLPIRKKGIPHNLFTLSMSKKTR
jgi:hypothetical protein